MDEYSQCHITLQQQTKITHVVSGYFLNLVEECFAFAQGKVIQFSKPNFETKNIHPVLKVKLFGSVCNIKNLKNNNDKDSLVVITDSGKMIIPVYHEDESRFVKFEFQFCNPGFHAQYPGHFLATDPQGCAILLGALLNKLVLYVRCSANVEDLNKFTKILLEFPGYEIIDMIGIKNKNYGFEFAVLRSKYTHDNEETSRNTSEIFIYRSDETGNFLEKCIHIDTKARLLAPVLSDFFEGSGVFVFTNTISFLSLDSKDACINEQKITEAINHQLDSFSENYFESITFKDSLLLAKNQKGGVIKFFIEISKGGLNFNINHVYLGNLPIINCWCIYNSTDNSQLLFTSSDTSAHSLYKIYEGSSLHANKLELFLNLRKFDLVFKTPSAFPYCDFLVGNFAHKGCSEIYVAGGKENNSFLKVFKQGLEMKSKFSMDWCQDISDKVLSAWIIKNEKFVVSKERHVFLLVSHEKKTEIMVFDMIENGLKGFDFKEKNDSPYVSNLKQLLLHTPYITNEQTLFCGAFGKNMILQVTPSQLVVLYGASVLIKKVYAFSPIFLCAVNKYNIVLLKKNGCLQYCRFKLYGENEVSFCVQDYHDKEVKEDTILLAIGKIKEEFKSPIICRAFANNLCLIGYFDLQIGSFVIIHKFQFSVSISSLEILTINTDHKNIEQVFNPEIKQLEEYIFVGFKNGRLQKYKLKSYQVLLTEGEQYHLSEKPIKLFKIKIFNNESVLIDSSTKWLFYCHKNYLRLSPVISNVSIKFIISYCHKEFENCFWNVTDKSINIMTLSCFEDILCQEQLPLSSTPCKILYDKNIKKLIAIEKQKYKTTNNFLKKEFMDDLCKLSSVNVVGCENNLNLKKTLRGGTDLVDFFKNHIREKDTVIKSKWKSTIEIIDPVKLKKEINFDLEEIEIVHSACVINISSNETFLIVGVLLKLEEENKNEKHAAYTFEIASFVDENGTTFYHIEKTHSIFLVGLPTAISVIEKNKVLIAEGDKISLYHFLDKQLNLIVNKELQNQITCLDLFPEKGIIVVGHLFTVSVLMVLNYNVLHIMAEKNFTHEITSVICLNDFTYAVTDAGGSITTISLTKENLAFESMLKENRMFGLNVQSVYRIGLGKINLIKFQDSAKPCLLYMTFSGSIGVFIEYNKKGAKLLKALESFAKNIGSDLCGEKHIDVLPFTDEEQMTLNMDVFDDFSSAGLLKISDKLNVDVISELHRCFKDLKSVHFIWPS